MGTNFYLIRKIKYNKEENTPTSLGCDSVDCTPKHINNGWIVNNTYYKTYEEFEENFEQEIHIGKSSLGWHFALAIYPEYGIHNFEDWKKLILDPNNIIKDEYGETVPPEVMITIITQRSGKRWKEGMSPEMVKKEEDDYIALLKTLDGPFRENYSSYDDFLIENHAERGNRLLLKHSSKYIKHVVDAEDPKATYDYIISGNDPEKGDIFS